MHDPTTPKHPQKFLLPLVLTVDSDDGLVDRIKVSYHVKDSTLPAFLAGHFYDGLDRNPDMPMPFAVRDAQIDWDAVAEISTPELDAEIEKTLQAKEQAVLGQNYQEAARLRGVGQELLRRRARLAAMGLPPLLRTALAWALSYARANVDDLNELYQEEGLVTAETYEALQKRFGLES